MGRVALCGCLPRWQRGGFRDGFTLLKLFVCFLVVLFLFCQLLLPTSPTRHTIFNQLLSHSVRNPNLLQQLSVFFPLYSSSFVCICVFKACQAATMTRNPQNPSLQRPPLRDLQRWRWPSLWRPLKGDKTYVVTWQFPFSFSLMMGMDMMKVKHVGAGVYHVRLADLVIF